MKKKFFVVLFILIAFVVLYLTTTSIEVGAFEAAVVESKFSKQPQVKRPGTRYKFLWSDVYIYDMSPIVSRHEIEVLDRDNNHVNITLVARFSPIREDLGLLHNETGKNYQVDFVDPYIISATVELASNYSPEELWISKRVEFETSLTDHITNGLLEKHIDLKSLIVLSINIPVELERIITEKYEQETDSLEIIKEPQ